MKIDKSLKEVWEWKKRIYQETKDISMEENIKRIKKNASKMKQKYRFALKTVTLQKALNQMHKGVPDC